MTDAWHTGEAYLQSAAPRVVEMATTAVEQAKPSITRATEAAQEALKSVGDRAGPLAKDLGDKVRQILWLSLNQLGDLT